MALIRLGLRLALAGGHTGRIRAIMSVVGAAVATVALLLAIATTGRFVPRPEYSCPSTTSCRGSQIAMLLFVSAVVVVLLATVARLSGAIRDRRLAGLRLLGTTGWATRIVAAVETAALALLGSAIGVPVFLLLRFALWRTNFAGVPRFGQELRPGWLAALAIVVAVPLLAVIVSLGPTRRITAAPLRVRRESVPGRPRLWRLVPLAVGLGLLAFAALRPYDPDGVNSALWWLIGAPLAAVGLPLAVPVGVRVIAGWLAERGPTVWLRLAGARALLEPVAATRVVAALVTGLMLVVAFQSLIVSGERVPQYRSALQAETTGPQNLHVDTRQPFTQAEFSALPGVRTAIPRRSALYSPGSCVAAANECASAYIGTCADLLAIMPGVGRCGDDEVALIGSKIQPPPGPIKLVVWGPGGQDRGATIPFSVTATQRLPFDESKNEKRDDFGGGYSEIYSMFIPRTTPGLPPAATFAESWSVTADGGPAVRQRLEQALRARDPDASVVSLADFDALRFVPRMRAILYAATWVVLLVGFLAVALAAVDRGAERRRGVVGLHALGVPPRVIRRSHLVQALLPMAVGIPIAGALGLLAGRGYLQLIGEAAYTPVVRALVVTAAALAIGVVLAVATLPVVNRRALAEDLRRE